MSRKEDPPSVDFTDERKTVCFAHHAMKEAIDSLVVTVKGNGSLKSQQESVVGTISKMDTTLRTNGLWLRGLAGFVVMVFVAIFIPTLSWIQTSGKILQRIETLQEHDISKTAEIKELKSVSYGYQDKHKVVTSAGPL